MGVGFGAGRAVQNAKLNDGIGWKADFWPVKPVLTPLPVGPPFGSRPSIIRLRSASAGGDN
jgi:hypothetical protein